MTVVPIRIEGRPDDRGEVFPLPIANDVERFGFAVLDVVIQTIEHGACRGNHFHESASGKIEIFVPIDGEAELVWHDRATPDQDHHMKMQPFLKKRTVYRVNPETCHVVKTKPKVKFVMASLNSTPYDPEKPDPQCKHGLAKQVDKLHASVRS
jgi:dTDP-4-dehydrorhamnose 3,5-epimerase-like enzyme